MRQMKDSGIEWIGQIPENINVIKNKYLIKYEKGKLPKDLNTEKIGIPYVGASELEDLSGEAEYTTYTTDVTIPQCDSSDVLILWDGARAGLIGTNHKGAVSSTIVNAFPIKELDKRFWYWYLKAFQQHLYNRVNGTTIPHMNTDYIEEIAMLDWGTEEQLRIAHFLDAKCAEIDALIEAKEKNNALLRECRQSIIYEAVTRGLNPDVPMKDSGIEWIGEIPSDWQVIPLSKVSERMNNGYVGPTRNIFFDSGVRYLQSLHIKEGKIIFEKAPYYVSLEWAGEHSLGTVHTGDVLIVQTGDIGQVACVPEEYNECNCHALIIVTPRSKFCVGEYLSYLLQSHYGRNQLLSCRTGALHPHLNSGNIGSIKLPIPTVGEQQAIVAKLNRECEEYDNAIQQNNLTIEKLKEYRRSIVYEAVTGKIEI